MASLETWRRMLRQSSEIVLNGTVSVPIGRDLDERLEPLLAALEPADESAEPGAAGYAGPKILHAMSIRGEESGKGRQPDRRRPPPRRLGLRLLEGSGVSLVFQSDFTEVAPFQWVLLARERVGTTDARSPVGAAEVHATPFPGS
jgi:hypothetical protein